MKRYSDPYLAGLGLGLVLLAAYVLVGRGLGASGGFASVVAAGTAAVEGTTRASASPALAPYLVRGVASPLGDWLVLELAGAFSNDGFKMRDGHWAGMLKPNDHVLVAVNLFAGNQYWFAAAADNEGKKVGVKIYDESGNQVTVENYDEGERAAAGFSPENSGQYFVSVSLLEGEPGSVCLVCSYK